MYVKCLHTSSRYPNGGQRENDIFWLTFKQTEFYEELEYVKRLPKEQQPKRRRGALGKEGNCAHDLSSGKFYVRKR